MFTTELEKLIPEMRGYARMLCGGRDLANDIVQNACLKAWNARKAFDPHKGSLKAWVFTITRNEFLQHLRKQKRVETYAPSDLENWVVEDCQMNNRAAFSEAIGALFTLSTEQRDVFILVIAAGYSYEEAAAICKCSVGTIKSRINRARAKLVALLESQEQSVSGSEKLERFHSMRDLLCHVDKLVKKAA